MRNLQKASKLEPTNKDMAIAALDSEEGQNLAYAIFVGLADMMDEAIKQGNAYCSLGQNKTKTSLLFTFFDAQDNKGYASGTNVLDLFQDMVNTLLDDDAVAYATGQREP